MSEPFTRAEAKSSVWAQLEDLEPAERVAVLYEVAHEIQREFKTGASSEEADKLVKALEEKGVKLEDLHPLISDGKERETDAIMGGVLWEAVDYLVDSGMAEELEELLKPGEADEIAELTEAIDTVYDMEDLDDTVIEKKEEEASAINNSSLEEQVRYLVGAGGIDWVKKLFAPKTKTQSKKED